MKRLVSVTLAFLLCFVALTACDTTSEERISKGELIGVWTKTAYENGARFDKEVVFRNDSTYTYTTWKNGNFYRTESGDFEVTGNEVRLYDETAITYHGVAIILRYENGSLSGFTKK